VIRRLDLGMVSPLRSQAIYHGLAAAMEATTPDTVVFCSPSAPYVCVGYHQSAAEVLDLTVCRRAGWPVYRRKIGGGAVYLDEAQLFYQCVVHRSRAPFAVDRVFARYLAGPVLALNRLGVAASLTAPNEIEVNGRRIAGTGGGQIGEGVVVVGNVLFDFADTRMARAWRAPSMGFRRLARDGLRRYVTTLRRELPRCPTPAAVVEAIAAAYAETLGSPLVRGRLTARERAAIRGAERELARVSFVLAGGGRRDAGLKISRGVYVFDGAVSGARPRVAVRVRDGLVDAVAVQGSPARRAAHLIGRPVSALAPSAPGQNPADIVGGILAAPAVPR
jgi:lipoate-protein ligase A